MYVLEENMLFAARHYFANLLVQVRSSYMHGADAWQQHVSRSTTRLRKQGANIEDFSDLHNVAVRVHMAEQAPAVRAHRVVPKDYDSYVQLAQAKEKEKEKRALESKSKQKESEVSGNGEAPEAAEGSLGWAALWKVTQVLLIESFQYNQ